MCVVPHPNHPIQYAISDDHVRVVQLTSSSYCFLDNLSRTLSRILLNKRTTGTLATEGLEEQHLQVRVAARQQVAVVRLLRRHVAAAIAGPKVAVALLPTLLQAVHGRARARLCASKTDEQPRRLMSSGLEERGSLLELDVSDRYGYLQK